MKALAITSRGIEKITSLEIKELIGAKSQEFDGCVVFDAKNEDEVIKFSYLTQSSERVLLLLEQCKISQLSDSIKKINFKNYLTKNKFKIIIEKINNDVINEEIIEPIAEEIIKQTKSKVNLENPDAIIFVFISNDELFIGIDLCGFELQKRQYRIFPHQSALRSTIAYALVRIAGYEKKLTLLDPFCGSGTIPIEAALHILQYPVNFFNKDKFIIQKTNKNFQKITEKIDKKILDENLKIYGYDTFMGSIVAARKNAKIAGIDKYITFSKIEASWLDTKFEKETIDLIVTQPPEPSKTKNEKDIERLYNEFFYQAEFILSKKGKIVMITRHNELLKQCAEKYKFVLKEEMNVFAGMQEMKVSIFVHH